MQKLRSKNILAKGRFIEGVLHIDDDGIAAIEAYSDDYDIDYGSFAILPGCVDVHVHINEPGRTTWEGFETGTKAAVAGGTTTIIDMPLNCIPSTTSVDALELKRDYARKNAYTNIGFWGGAVPGNASDIPKLAAAGVRGFKCFMAPSGVDEFDFVTTEDLEEAARAIQPTGLTLLAHAEDPATIENAMRVWSATNGQSYSTYLKSRPEEAEEIAVQTLVRISKKYDLHVHVVHVASTKAVDVIRQAKKDGVKITAETCAHYLCFSSEDILDSNTVYKCAPPIRDKQVQESLWQALDEGVLDFITTDHSPSLPSSKGLDKDSDIFGRFDKAWGGIASIELLLTVIWTEADKRGYRLEQVSNWLSSAPANWNRLSTKGKIEKGADADLVIFDPIATRIVDVQELQHRHKVSPYDGKAVRGKIVTTYVNGKIAYDGDERREFRKYGKLV